MGEGHNCRDPAVCHELAESQADCAEGNHGRDHGHGEGAGYLRLGRGDIGFMLESGDMGGKCADLNALYVGLARSVGLPARHVYGLRIAKSELGYKSLGVATDKATKGQHCRVEVYLREHGGYLWTRPMSAKWLWKNLPEIIPWTIRSCRGPAIICSVHER